MGGRQRRKEKEVEEKSEDARYGSRERARNKEKRYRGDKKKVGGKVAEVECCLHSSNNMSTMLKIGSHKQLS